jgi:hypothetical protein
LFGTKDPDYHVIDMAAGLYRTHVIYTASDGTTKVRRYVQNSGMPSPGDVPP